MVIFSLGMDRNISNMTICLFFHKNRVSSGMRRKSILSQYSFSVFKFFLPFFLSHYYSDLFAVVIDRLGLLSMKTIIKASLPRAIFTLEQLSAVTGNFAVKFTQISENFRAYLRLQ